MWGNCRSTMALNETKSVKQRIKEIEKRMGVEKKALEVPYLL